MALIAQSADVEVARGAHQLEQMALHPVTDWPPPGTHMAGLADALQDAWPLPHARNPRVVADLPPDGTGELPIGGFWWTTLGQMYADFPDQLSGLALKLVARFGELEAGDVGAVLAIPVVYEGGTVRMRWISTTYRGTLGGGVEEFQHKMDLGVPGNDPDLSESDALLLAEQLAAIWYLRITSGSPALQGWISPEVVWTEVGVVQKVSTAATDKDGKGGNLSQSYGTQWNNYLTGARPAGQGGVTLPYEVSCAVSLQTDQRGPRGKGRFYLPPFSQNSQVAGGLFQTAFIADLALAMKGWLNDIKAATPYVPIVVSRRALQLHEITSLRIGHVPDSQRRRRRSQAEAYAEQIL